LRKIRSEGAILMGEVEVSILELFQHRRRKAFSLAGKTNNSLRGRPKTNKLQ